ncbi:Indoleamine 2,3-dioxygenase [Lepidopterella palustris CBS 459.81]|uniref:Indoleamine 2,3-dioxygenase n=1 Tax=Lepidopterella palustris CBS 459.81 TaxID=1314670 RepID=A0A8E2E588_9PEZI|nr:Indoleamine 2,3-dioxygenase [Lepidopterella palustris CBS 459.81]
MAQILARLEDYHVSSTSGFLPSSPPLESLLDPYYTPWESIISVLPCLIRDGSLRERVAVLPLLETEILSTEEEWRRAYVILGYLCNGYIFSRFPPTETLPLCLSRPMIEVSTHLGLPPVPTYSGQTLWNHRFCGKADGLIHSNSIQTLASFTGSPEESSFFGISVAIEACGAPLIPALLSGIEAASQQDWVALEVCLQKAEGILNNMTTLLPTLYQSCSPEFFYTTLRPFLEGTKDLASVGLPNGVFFEEKDGGSCRKYCGPSNAQSSLFVLVDIALGVNHSTSSHRSGHTNASFGQQEILAAKTQFLDDMRWYMPRGHRRFLNEVERVSNIKAAIRSNSHNLQLREAYHDCLAALAQFRQKHIQMVTRYVVVMAKQNCNTSKERSKGDELESGGAAKPVSVAGANGTGGTRPIAFLKSVRDDVLCAAQD